MSTTFMSSLLLTAEREQHELLKVQHELGLALDLEDHRTAELRSRCRPTTALIGQRSSK
ncbi:hypothetical protein V7S43_000500 [Phytophthora oleae]|uniref:Uncharacterized protein n=1 Tax=Phytophthora oleae TaxID=2107226 RepID=A0ABD3G5W7_9STRA